jgi:hypothetical protein
LIVLIPGEYAQSICGQQPFDRKITADCKQSIRISQRAFRIGEMIGRIRRVDPVKVSRHAPLHRLLPWIAA